jgi:hypothetical protein
MSNPEHCCGYYYAVKMRRERVGVRSRWGIAAMYLLMQCEQKEKMRIDFFAAVI